MLEDDEEVTVEVDVLVEDVDVDVREVDVDELVVEDVLVDEVEVGFADVVVGLDVGQLSPVSLLATKRYDLPVLSSVYGEFVSALKMLNSCELLWQGQSPSGLTTSVTLPLLYNAPNGSP